MNEVQAYLNTKLLGRKIHYEFLTSSTQIIAHQWASNNAPDGAVVIADGQREGRGRSGKKWCSPIGTGIWMSVILRPPIPIRDATHFTLLSSVAVQKGIYSMVSPPIQIKWPNDLLINKKKVCGILTEARSSSNQLLYMVIGIGVNVNALHEDFPQELREIATSLRIESGEKISRSMLVAAILYQIELYYFEYLQRGFQSIKDDWEVHCGIMGTQISAFTAQGRVTGKVLQLSNHGELLIQTRQGVNAINSPFIELS